MSTPLSCQQPFERGPKLCSVCRLTTGLSGFGRCSRMVAVSPAMRRLLVKAGPIAAAGASVVLQGESGTGKEVLARALHANSPRRAKPFVPVNVAAIPGELLESELFGHVKGAFTGAVTAKRGLFAAANTGTLFLDEIGELPLPLQAKLLRALQEGEVRPVGDTQATAVDVRIVCATNRDLRARVDGGHFREDLFYRLSVFTLRVPPLRERVEDVMPLVELFLEREGRTGAAVSAKVRRALESYAWPGNVRELQNAIVHAVTLAQGGELAVEHLPDPVLATRAPPPAPAPTTDRRPLAEVEREHVLRVLDACGGNQSEAAEVLGIGRNTLWRKLRAYADGGSA